MNIKELTKSEYLSFERRSHIHPLQSFAWGEVKKPQWNPVRLGIYGRKLPISIITILTKDIPFCGKKFGYISRGIPIFSPEHTQSICNAVKHYAQKYAFLLVDLDKNLKSKGKENKTDDLEQCLKSEGFQVRGKQVQQSRTVILDLSKSEDDLLADMRSKHRQYIRKAQRLGVCIRQGSTRDIDSFCYIMRLIARQRGYLLHDASYYAKVWKEFSRCGNVALFLAEYNKEVVGSYMVLLSKDRAYEMYGGCTQKGNKLLANYIMKWEAIRYCKQIGKRWYDQWGAEHQYPGLVQFKEGFGGYMIEYPPQYVYIYNKVAFRLYQVFEKVNRLRQQVERRG